MSTYICKICGEEFERVGNAVYCSNQHYRSCPVCGKPVVFHRPSEPIKCCSSECRRTYKIRNASEADLRKCPICDKTFYPEHRNQRYCKGPHIATCIICGKEFEYSCSPKDKPNTCSASCKDRLRKQTVQIKYGVDNVSKLEEVQKRISEHHKSPNTYKKTDRSKGITYTERICKFCGKPFLGSGTKLYCDDKHFKTCVVCGGSSSLIYKHHIHKRVLENVHHTFLLKR